MKNYVGTFQLCFIFIGYIGYLYIMYYNYMYNVFCVSLDTQIILCLS